MNKIAMGSTPTISQGRILRVKWKSRTAGFQSSSVEELIQKACTHYKIGSSHTGYVLVGKFDNEEMELTDDVLKHLPSGSAVTLVKVPEDSGDATSPRPFQVFVKTLTGETMSFNISAADSVGALKGMIQDREYIPAEQQHLFFGGEQMEDGHTLSDYSLTNESVVHLVLWLRGGKPVIYFLIPYPIPATTVSVSLVPQWSFSHIYPIVDIKTDADGGQYISWQVSAHPDGTLIEKTTGTELSYLFWEALSNPDTTPPSPPSSPVDAAAEQYLSIEHFDPAYPSLEPNSPTAVMLPFVELLPYLDANLKNLTLHTSARNDFITYWLPALSKKPFVALRFLPQVAYERAAELTVEPKPDVVTRVFMLFRGVASEDEELWTDARARIGRVDWKDVVGVKPEASDEGLFRVLEWGAMEVL